MNRKTQVILLGALALQIVRRVMRWKGAVGMSRLRIELALAAG